MGEQPTTFAPLKQSTRVRAARGGYLPIQLERRVKHYSVSSTELVVLSALNPIAAALVGWGCNLLSSQLALPAGESRDSAMKLAIVALVLGGIVQVVVWGFLAMVWFQSRERG